MDVSTPDDMAVSRRSLVTLLAATAIVVGLGVFAFSSPSYARAVAVALTAFSSVLVVRTIASALLAFARRSPPALYSERELPAVSVVVTAYNEVRTLPRTLRACRALDYPEEKLEIVVGYESASTDGTGALAERIAARDPSVVAVERPGPPGGKAAATNHALAHATGEVIAVLDADQRPRPDTLRRAVRWFRDEDVWCVKGRCFGTNARASLVASCATVERHVAERAEFYARDLLGGFAFFTGGQAFFRAATFEAVGAFDETILLEDLDMAVRIGRSGGEIRIDPEVMTYEHNPETITAWWHQRKRWARGGMQVARRYVGVSLLTGPPQFFERVDVAGTFGALLAVPVLALAAPTAVPGWLWAGGSLGPVAAVLLACVLVAPTLAASLVFVLDRRDGHRHEAREYLAAVVLWPYFLLQCGAVVAAFLEEFVLRRPVRYVTSTSAKSTGRTSR